MLKFLKHDDAGALAHDETVAALVPRPRAGLRVVVEAGRQRAGSGKTGHAERANGCLGTAGDHHIGIVPHDDTGGIADGMRSEEHTSELQSLMRISYAVFCLKKKKTPSY